MLLIRHWWLIALRGISSILFSLYFFFYPDLTIEILAKGFCFYAIADGTLCLLISVLSTKKYIWRIFFFIIGVFAIAASLLTLYQPMITAVFLLISLGPWVILSGVLEIVAGNIFKKDFKGTGWLRVTGIISVVIGLLLTVQPFVGFPPLATLIGTFQILRGVINLLASFILKRNQAEMELLVSS